MQQMLALLIHTMIQAQFLEHYKYNPIALVPTASVLLLLQRHQQNIGLGTAILNPLHSVLPVIHFPSVQRPSSRLRSCKNWLHCLCSLSQYISTHNSSGSWQSENDTRQNKSKVTVPSTKHNQL